MELRSVNRVVPNRRCFAPTLVCGSPHRRKRWARQGMRPKRLLTFAPVGLSPAYKATKGRSLVDGFASGYESLNVSDDRNQGNASSLA